MASIKRISKCFQEVKRLTGDLLPEEKIDEILFKAKQKINENKFQQQQSKTDKLLAEEIINEFEYDQAIKKRNLAEKIAGTGKDKAKKLKRQHLFGRRKFD